MSQEILKELEQEFNSIKKELKFRSTLQQIEKIYPISDVVLKEGYVPNDLPRAICRGIIDNIHNWSSYLHGLLIPNPHHLISMNESQFFSEEEKKLIFNLLSETMTISSKNALLSLTNNKNEEAKIIDELVNFWNKKFSPKLQEVMKKVNTSWQEKSKDSNVKI